MGRNLEQSVNEFWSIMDATPENYNAWQTNDRNGKGIRDTTETQDRIELVIFGDSITKYISPERIVKSNMHNPVKVNFASFSWNTEIQA